MTDVHQLVTEIICQKEASPEYTEWAGGWNELSQHTRNNVLIQLQEYLEHKSLYHTADIMIFLVGIGIEMGNSFNTWITQFPRLSFDDRNKVYEGLQFIQWETKK
jgi:hypothetical protein